MLALYLLGMCMIGPRIVAWPLVNCEVYSTMRPRPIATIKATHLLCVTDSTGERTWLWPKDLWGMERLQVGEQLIRRGFDPAASSDPQPARIYLHRAARILRPDVKPAVFEGWRVEWTVDPLALPPLDRDNPVKRTLLGRFEVSPTQDASLEAR